ncbi:MAG: 30S ribosomal protein S18 [Planctomycetota bacterium]|nr:MAG: 30S ribosomal protein S18 [Planctomycetota bacterium]
MSRFNRFGPAGPQAKLTRTGSNGKIYVDWKDVDALRRCMTPNGKIYGRKRLGTSAREQRLIAQAIKRARFMGLLPFTSATL